MIRQSQSKIKCVVWDLDNTFWDGVLLEDINISPKKNIIETIKALDQKGVLHSIASRNDYETAKNKLVELSMWDYFVYPEINWNNKSESVKRIAEQINISIDTLAFVDDQIFELDEVKSVHPTISAFQPEKVNDFLTMDAFIPRFTTKESANRRLYYQNDIRRNQAQLQAQTNIEFLRSLDLSLTVKRVGTDDLKRAEELTLRTHQLNTTGITYTYEELHALMNCDQHLLLCCTLEDNYGAYGTIGLALIEKKKSIWTICLLLMSCRVISRNIGNTLLAFITKLANKENVILRVKFIENNVNRQMYITYKFNGFEEIEKKGSESLLEYKKTNYLEIPHYVTIRSDLL